MGRAGTRRPQHNIDWDSESHLSPGALSPSCKKKPLLLILSTAAFNHLDLNVLGEGSNRFSNRDINLSEPLFSD